MYIIASGPSLALCLAREDAVEAWRNMIGPKEVSLAKEEAPERYIFLFDIAVALNAFNNNCQRIFDNQVML